ncbi:MAG: hypothetical protein WDN45_02580 [Caulobacteraceae bacterium]
MLTDGAAAQYGTDAIAGVVNIILKKNSHGGTISAQGGQYYKGDGLQTDFSANLGIAPTDKTFLNLTFESKYHGLTFFGDVDPRVVIRSSTDTTNTARLATYPLIKSFPNYPYVNRIGGNGQAQQQNLMLNAGYDATRPSSSTPSANIGYHDGRAYENYRVPSAIVSSANVPLYPAGFGPMENNRDVDYALTMGAKGDHRLRHHLNFTSAYGRDYERVYVLGSGNADLYYDTGATPTNFHDGDFTNTQWTNTVDLTHTLDLGLAEPLTLAAGGEYRIDSYQIKAGDPESYYATRRAPLGNGGGAQSF